MKRAVLAGLLFARAVWPAQAMAADYSFDLSEIDTRPYEFSGFGESKLEHFALQPGAALYPLSYAPDEVRRSLVRGSLSGELSGQYRAGTAMFYGRASLFASSDALDSSATGQWLEAGVRVSPSESLSFDLGKQVQRWGKGYAWNPVGFFERPKDPNDPSASREGFVMASANWVRSLSGPWVSAVGLTPVLLPTSSGVNSDFGATNELNPGARLYMLVANTDVDLLWAAKGSRPQRIGLDFSRNLGSQLEVHGEWARALDASRQVLGPYGRVSRLQGTIDSWLLGVRYTTEREVTWVGELYRNGAGYDQQQLADYYHLLREAYAPGASAFLQSLAGSLAKAGYGKANPGRDYAYLRVSSKDPFDWLYVNPAITAIVNLQDRSWQLSPEVVYTGWQNVEVRAKVVWLHGKPMSEYGEKASKRRAELSLRLYF